ncbi:MAG: sigma-70 family RNA polymerase sigma factor [Clostridiaceae bacterium]|jgi:RNA polymerase sigma-70 factor, ECF subfamily|nr:sigma-70 family RNA polymerase sigma factor [Clostridiaceae bacterium]
MTGNKLTYKKMSLKELVVFAQQDDFKALEELIKREQRNVFAAFCYMTNDRETIPDLTQDVLLKIAKNIKNLKHPNIFKSWENQIIINVFYDSLRKSQRKPMTISIDEESEDSYQVTQIPDKKSKPVDKCLTAELEKIIKSAILTLPEPFRVAIILRELQGLSYEEIAHATNATVGTVKSRISRARGKLQNDLKAYI